MILDRDNINRYSRTCESGVSTVAKACIICLATAAGSPATWAAQDADFDLLFDDWEEQAGQVNEGVLDILAGPPRQAAHQHINHLTIDANSVDSGWVSLVQCHYDLDAVPALQIMFRHGGVRDLRITESTNIGRSWVEGHSVQLADVGHDSSLCLSAETLALSKGEKGVVLANGPYMRRFLDGFYPMRVKLRVSYPDEVLRFRNSSPLDFTQVKTGELLMDVWFEGELRTSVHFDRL